MSPRRAAAGARPATWRNRIVGSGEEDPTQLLANPLNWRTHPGPQRDALRGSLAEVGWVQQVLVNRTTGHVVDGHARIEEAISRGEEAVPVLYIELTLAEEAIVLASLDPLSAMAVPDMAKLAELLAEVTISDEALAAMVAGLDGSPLSAEERERLWRDMPEFDQPDALSYAHVVVHFRNEEDRAAFFALLGRGAPQGRQGIWYPAELRESITTTRYVVPEEVEA